MWEHYGHYETHGCSGWSQGPVSSESKGPGETRRRQWSPDTYDQLKPYHILLAASYACMILRQSFLSFFSEALGPSHTTFYIAYVWVCCVLDHELSFNGLMFAALGTFWHCKDIVAFGSSRNFCQSCLRFLLRLSMVMPQRPRSWSSFPSAIIWVRWR